MLLILLTLEHQSQKMVKHTQTIRRQIAKLQFKLQIAIRRQSVKKSANVKIFILFT